MEVKHLSVEWRQTGRRGTVNIGTIRIIGSGVFEIKDRHMADATEIAAVIGARFTDTTLERR